MINEGEKESKLPLLPLAILGTGLLGIGIAVGSYGAYVTILISHGITPAAAGFGMTLYLFGQLVMVLPMDMLTRRYGSAHVAAIGFVIAGVGAAVGGFLDLTVVYLSRTLLGFGTGAAFLASVKYVGHRSSNGSRSLAQGIIGAMFTLGIVFGLAVGTTILNQYGTLTFALFTAVVTTTPAIIVPRLRTVPKGNVRRLKAYFMPLRSPSSIVLGLANMASFGLLIVATTWYAEVLATEPMLPTFLILIGFSLTTVLGRFGGGWLARIFNERVAVTLTLALLCMLLGGTAISLIFDASILLGMILIASGAGFGLPFGPLFSLAFSNLSDDPGITLTAMIAVGNAGALAYPWLIGWTSVMTGSYAVGFIIMALTVALVVVLWLQTIGVTDTTESPSSEADATNGQSQG